MDPIGMVLAGQNLGLRMQEGESVIVLKFKDRRWSVGVETTTDSMQVALKIRQDLNKLQAIQDRDGIILGIRILLEQGAHAF